ncbi:hypothetical protein Pelo_342 [Pelomyxa schiedti]|nr:hypothetical protein Pelo_342 [Pelomyxa schiedti]
MSCKTCSCANMRPNPFMPEKCITCQHNHSKAPSAVSSTPKYVAGNDTLAENPKLRRTGSRPKGDTPTGARKRKKKPASKSTTPHSNSASRSTPSGGSTTAKPAAAKPASTPTPSSTSTSTSTKGTFMSFMNKLVGDTKEEEKALVITGPTSCHHGGHIGYSEEKGFVTSNLPPELSKLFSDLDVELKKQGQKPMTRAEATDLLKNIDMDMLKNITNEPEPNQSSKTGTGAPPKTASPSPATKPSVPTSPKPTTAPNNQQTTRPSPITRPSPTVPSSTGSLKTSGGTNTTSTVKPAPIQNGSATKTPATGSSVVTAKQPSTLSSSGSSSYSSPTVNRPPAVPTTRPQLTHSTSVSSPTMKSSLQTTSNSNSSANAAQTQLIESLRKEIHEKDSLIDKLQLQVAQIDTLKKSVATLTQDKETLSTAKRNLELEVQEASLKARLPDRAGEEMQRSLKELQSKYDLEMKGLKEEINRERGKNLDLAKGVETSKSEVENCRKRLLAVEKEKEALVTSVRAKDAEVRELQAHSAVAAQGTSVEVKAAQDKLKREFAEMQKRFEDELRSAKETAAREGEMRGAERAAKEMALLKTELETTKKALSVALKERDDAHSATNKATLELKELRVTVESSTKGASDLAGLRETLEREMKALKKKQEDDLAKIRVESKKEQAQLTEAHTKTVSQFESKIQQLQRTIATHEQENDRLQAECSRLSSMSNSAPASTPHSTHAATPIIQDEPEPAASPSPSSSSPPPPPPPAAASFGPHASRSSAASSGQSGGAPFTCNRWPCRPPFLHPTRCQPQAC